MRFRQFIAVLLISMLAISPAMAAYCQVACEHTSPVAATVSESMAGMQDCHHHDKAPAKSADSHGKCNMAGCHSTASAVLFSADSRQPYFDPVTLHSRFIAKAVSADLPPPIKPPA